MSSTRKPLVAMAVLFVVLSTGASEPKTVLNLWPGRAPGDSGSLGEEHDATKPSDGLIAGKRLIRLGNVSTPTLAVYTPAGGNQNGIAVLVCPGGAYSILALDLEGTEICDWLNSVGVTGLLLKYRVPKRPGLEKHTAALQDAQRAMGLARQHAGVWGIDPGRIGAMGFSAGGHLAAVLGSQYDKRSYPQVDSADTNSCRPDFTVLIYPAYLTEKDEGERVAPELTLNSNTPPAFLAMAADDPVRVDNVLFFAAALSKARVPFALHVYPTGGHGYGLRRSKELVTTWPERLKDWMQARGLLDGR